MDEEIIMDWLQILTSPAIVGIVLLVMYGNLSVSLKSLRDDLKRIETKLERAY